jgi:TPP-dependent pyruvate/acetoin dehydrogenase alpha subunit
VPESLEDPLDWFAYRLLERGSVTLEALQRIDTDVCAEVEQAIARARAEPDAGVAELGLEDVFA